MDAQSAITGAVSQRALNADQATAFGKGQALGDVFAQLSYLYGQRRRAADVDAARRDSQGFTPSTGIGGGRPSYGTITG